MMIKLIDILSEELENRLLTESDKAPSPIGPTHITDRYGIPRNVGKHRGIDLRAPVGTTIFSPGDGVVKSAVKVNKTYDEIRREKYPNNPDGNDRCGSRVTIQHTSGPLNGLKTIFCHMSDIYVSNGDRVSIGDVIGKTGGAKGAIGAGNTTGPHLHLGLKNGSEFLNPLDYIDIKKGFDDMVGTQVSQEPIPQDYEDNTSEPLPPTKKYELSMDSFDEFVEDTFPQERKDEIESVNLEMLDGNMYFVIYKKNNKPDMFYLFKNGSYKLQNI